MKTLAAMLMLGLALLQACSNEAPVVPNQPLVPCDTCQQDAPLSQYDSLWQEWPQPHYWVHSVKFVPGTSIMTGNVFTDGWRGIFFSGFILDTTTGHIQYVGSTTFSFSRDGKRVLVENGFHGMWLIDLPTMTYRVLTTQNYSHPVWSIDEQWVFFQYEGDTYRMRPDGSEVTRIVERFPDAWPLDEDRLISFASDLSGLAIYNMTTRVMTPLTFTGLPQGLRLSALRPRDISPDRTKILADIWTNQGFEEREKRGLYLFDLRTMTARKVLKGQYWGNEYYPQWSSNSTFFGTFYCRKDTASMVYEYDLNGRVLRQVTTKKMILYP